MLHKAIMIDGVCVTKTGFFVFETVDALSLTPLSLQAPGTVCGAKTESKSNNLCECSHS